MLVSLSLSYSVNANYAYQNPEKSTFQIQILNAWISKIDLPKSCVLLVNTANQFPMWQLSPEKIAECTGELNLTLGLKSETQVDLGYVRLWYGNLLELQARVALFADSNKCLYRFNARAQSSHALAIFQKQNEVYLGQISFYQGWLSNSLLPPSSGLVKEVKIRAIGDVRLEANEALKKVSGEKKKVIHQVLEMRHWYRFQYLRNKELLPPMQFSDPSSEELNEALMHAQQGESWERAAFYFLLFLGQTSLLEPLETNFLGKWDSIRPHIKDEALLWTVELYLARLIADREFEDSDKFELMMAAIKEVYNAANRSGNNFFQIESLGLLALQSTNKKRYKEAETYFSKAQDLALKMAESYTDGSIPLPELHALIEVIHLRLNNQYKAGEYQNGLMLMRNFPDTMWNPEMGLLLSAYLLQLGRNEEALLYIDSLLSNDLAANLKRMLFHNRVISLYRLDRYVEARHVLNELLDKDGAPGNDLYRMTYAALNAIDGERELALGIMENSLQSLWVNKETVISNLEVMYSNTNNEQLEMNTFFDPVHDVNDPIQFPMSQFNRILLSSKDDKNINTNLLVYQESTGDFEILPKFAIAKSADIAAIGTGNGNIWIWQPSTGFPLKHFQASESYIRKLYLSNDGNNLWILTNSYIQKINVLNGEMIYTFGHDGKNINDFVIDEQANLLISADHSKGILVTDLDTLLLQGKYEHSVVEPEIEYRLIRSPKIIQMSTDTQFIYGGYTDKLYIWDRESGEKEIKKIQGEPYWMGLDASGEFLAIHTRVSRPEGESMNLSVFNTEKNELIFENSISSMFLNYFYDKNNRLIEVNRKGFEKPIVSEINLNTGIATIIDERVEDYQFNTNYEIIRVRDRFEVKNTSDGNTISRLKPQGLKQYEAHFIESNDLLFVLSENFPRLWSTSTGQVINIPKALINDYEQLLTLDENHSLLVHRYDRPLQIIDWRDLSLINLDLHHTSLTKIDSVHKYDGAWLIVSSNGYVGDMKEVAFSRLDWLNGEKKIVPLGSNLKIHDSKPFEMDWGQNIVWLFNSDKNELQSVDISTGEVRKRIFDDSFRFATISNKNTLKLGANLLIENRKEILSVNFESLKITKIEETLGEIIGLLKNPKTDELLRFINTDRNTFVRRHNPQSGQSSVAIIKEGPFRSIRYSTNGTYLLATTTDHRILFINPSSLKTELTLMNFSDDRWLVVDSEGRYDSNDPGDIPNASWVLKDEPLHPYPLELFMKKYYEPGLLSRTLKGEKFSSIEDLDSINKEIPRVTIESVRADSQILNMVNIDVRVSRGASTVEPRNLRVFREGQLVAYSGKNNRNLLENNETEKLFTFQNVRLKSGSDNIDFSAYAFNQEDIRSRRAHYPYENKADQYDHKKRPRAFLITIGVSHYSNSSWNLDYATDDSNAVHDWFSNADSSPLTNKYEIVPIQLLSDATNRTASKREIERVLSRLAGTADRKVCGDWCSIPMAGPDDLILFSFSGHGVVEKGEFYFFLRNLGEGAKNIEDKNALDNVLLNHALSSQELAEMLQPVDAGDYILIVDACQSAGALESDSFKPGPMGSRGLGQLAYDKQMLFLAASQAEKDAFQNETLRHGYLTYTLIIEGLKNNLADFYPKDGELSAVEWLGYGVARVPEIIQEQYAGTFKSLMPDVKKSPRNPDDDSRLQQQPVMFNFSRNSKINLKMR